MTPSYARDIMQTLVRADVLIPIPGPRNGRRRVALADNYESALKQYEKKQAEVRPALALGQFRAKEKAHGAMP